MTAASRYFCCLTAADRTVLASLSAAFVAALNQPIPLDTFDTITLAFTFARDTRRRALYTNFALEDTFIVVEDAPPIPAAGIVDVLVWLDLEGFLLTGGGACPGGCDEPRWSR